jgi:hypothetical protein
VTYQLVPLNEKRRSVEDLLRNYDPQKVEVALRKTAGSWADMDTDKLIADIYRWRDEGLRPIDRP